MSFDPPTITAALPPGETDGSKHLYISRVGFSSLAVNMGYHQRTSGLAWNRWTGSTSWLLSLTENCSLPEAAKLLDDNSPHRSPGFRALFRTVVFRDKIISKPDGIIDQKYVKPREPEFFTDFGVIKWDCDRYQYEDLDLTHLATDPEGALLHYGVETKTSQLILEICDLVPSLPI